MSLKTKIILGAVICAMVIAQIIYSAKKGKKAPEPAVAAAQPAAVSFSVPDPQAVAGIVLAHRTGLPLVTLSKTAGGWVIDSLHRAPADSTKIERFLDDLANAAKIPPNPEKDFSLATTGLGEGQGVVVRLSDAAGKELTEVILGLSPAESYDAVYAMPATGGGVFVLPGDFRGDLGLWRNQADALPKSQAWLQTRVFDFAPEAVSGLEASYPDHKIVFKKEPTGDWSLESAAPGGSWNRAGLEAWLADLAAFRITGVADSADRSALGIDSPSHRLIVTLAGGATKSLNACPNRTGEGMLVETSDRPGQVYLLPEWRFKRYFQRMTSLFPAATPAYAVADIRFLDIRRGGESVKLSLRDGEWRAVAQPYPLRSERVERLTRLLSAWHPEDYADPREKTARPAHGGPLLEATLANGDVYQYRLGGRHPLFPWRYVLVNGTVLLSANDDEAMVMFPDFAEVLDLGLIFPDVAAEQLRTLDVTAVYAGERTIRFTRNETGDWEAENEFGKDSLTEAEKNSVVYAPLAWKVAGLADRSDDAANAHGVFKLTMSDGGTMQRTAVLFPFDGDTPALQDGDRTLLLDRQAFFAWLAAVKGVDDRIRLDAARKDAKTVPAPESGDAIDKDDAPGEKPAPAPETPPEEAGQVPEPAPAAPDQAEPEQAKPAEEATGSAPVAVESVASDSEMTDPQSVPDADPQPSEVKESGSHTPESEAAGEGDSEHAPAITEHETAPIAPTDSAAPTKEAGREMDNGEAKPVERTER